LLMSLPTVTKYARVMEHTSVVYPSPRSAPVDPQRDPNPNNTANETAKSPSGMNINRSSAQPMSRSIEAMNPVVSATLAPAPITMKV